MTNLIIAAAVALAIGLVIGMLIGPSGQGTTLKQRRTEQPTEELRTETTPHQAQVNEHLREAPQPKRGQRDT